MVEGAYSGRRKVLLLLVRPVTDSALMSSVVGQEHMEKVQEEACLQSGQIVLPVVPESPSCEAAKKWAKQALRQTL